MDRIFCVSFATTCGMYVEASQSFHTTETEARQMFNSRLDEVGFDRVLITLTRVELPSMDCTCIDEWEGNEDDL